MVPASRKVGGSGAQHFQCGALGGQAFIGFGVGHVGRHQPVVDERLEIQAVERQSACQRFAGGMHMGVDETRGDDEAAAVDDHTRLIHRCQIGGFADCGNGVSGDGEGCNGR